MNGRLIWTARVYDHAPALLIQLWAHLPLHWHGPEFRGQSWGCRNPHSCPYNTPTFQLI